MYKQNMNYYMPNRTGKHALISYRGTIIGFFKDGCSVMKMLQLITFKKEKLPTTSIKLSLF